MRRSAQSISVDRQGDRGHHPGDHERTAKYAASFIDSPNRRVVDMQGRRLPGTGRRLKSDGDPVPRSRQPVRVGRLAVVVEPLSKVGYRITSGRGAALVLEPGGHRRRDKAGAQAKETTRAPATIPPRSRSSSEGRSSTRRRGLSSPEDRPPARGLARGLEGRARRRRGPSYPGARGRRKRDAKVRTSQIGPRKWEQRCGAPEVRARTTLVKAVTLAPIALVPVPAQATPPPASPPATHRQRETASGSSRSTQGR